jgi:RimJ/RimL family protein N-acetyltransferase
MKDTILRGDEALEHINVAEKEIILENCRVRLVPFTRDYEDELRKIIFDEELSFSVNCKSDSDVRNYVERTIKQRTDSIAYPFIVMDKLTNEVAGSTRYGHISLDNKRLEIGWTWYGRKFRGTGLNKACKYELLNYAFETMKFRRVQFSADIENIRSQKAILNLGAAREGLFRAMTPHNTPLPAMSSSLEANKTIQSKRGSLCL